MSEYRTRGEWDDSGNLVVHETDGDLGGHGPVADGVADSRQTRTYDDQGNLMIVERDDGADGSLDRRCTYDPPCPPSVYEEAVFNCSGPCVEL